MQVSATVMDFNKGKLLFSIYYEAVTINQSTTEWTDAFVSDAFIREFYRSRYRYVYKRSFACSISATFMYSADKRSL